MDQQLYGKGTISLTESLNKLDDLTNFLINNSDGAYRLTGFNKEVGAWHGEHLMRGMGSKYFRNEDIHFDRYNFETKQVEPHPFQKEWEARHSSKPSPATRVVAPMGQNIEKLIGEVKILEEQGRQAFFAEAESLLQQHNPIIQKELGINTSVKMNGEVILQDPSKKWTASLLGQYTRGSHIDLNIGNIYEHQVVNMRRAIAALPEDQMQRALQKYASGFADGSHSRSLKNSFIDTLAHENRHAYQNTLGYLAGTENVAGHYKDQRVEVDARQYAEGYVQDIGKQRRSPSEFQQNIKFSYNNPVNQAVENPVTPQNAPPVDPPTKHKTVPPIPDVPDSPSGGSKTHTVGSVLKDDVKNFAAKPFKHRAAVSGIVGGTYSLLTNDKKGDQSIISTILDTGMGAATAIGVESAVSYIVREHGNQIGEFFSSAKNLSTGDLAKVTSEIDTGNMVDEAKTAKGKRALGRAGFGAKGIGVFIGATALLGVSNKLHRNTEAQRMQNEAEYALYKKEKEEGKMLSQLFGYNKHQPMGQLVMDMWDDRMGHHKMGNAKFY